MSDGESVGSPVADADAFSTPTIRLLSPHYACESRQASVSSAVFTLVSTIMGGAVLSLPWAIAQTGLVAGLASILFWALAADLSIYVLLMCARRTGAATYEEVASHAFGPWMRTAVVIQVQGAVH